MGGDRKTKRASARASRAFEGAFYTWVVPSSDRGKRLDRFLKDTGRFPSRHQIQKLVSEGLVWVDGLPGKASQRLRASQEVRVRVPPPAPVESRAESIPLEVLYEDQDLLVVNKPAGMVVHPAAGHPGGTLVNALLFHCKDLSGVGGKLRPGIVHRLDKDTSGLLVVAKNDPTHIALSGQFKEHSVLREYLGLVHGVVPAESGTEITAIGRHLKDRKRMSSRTRSGKQAVTHWRVVRRFQGFTFLRFTLETGRTHQIRVHMAEQGHPIVGDPLYGGKLARLSRMPRSDPLRQALEGVGRLFLHADRLGFSHPKERTRLLFSCALPEELSRALQALRPLSP